MSKTYEPAPKEVEQRALALIEHHYPDITKSGLTIEYLFARNDGGYAIVHGGYPAIGLCRIVNLKDRAKGNKDAEITICAETWEKMKPEQRDALLDHELNHLILVRDDMNGIKFDDLERPKLKIRKHDWQMGWFTCIAQRHGLNSPEVVQAKTLWDSDGQAFFALLTDTAKKK